MTHQTRGGAVTQRAIEGERQTVSVAFSVDQDDFAPGGSAGWARAGYVPLGPSVNNLTISGFEAPSSPVPDDFVIHKTIRNTTSNTLLIGNEDTGSLAANRIRTQTGGTFQMSPISYAMLLYDVEGQRWDMVGFSNSWPVFSTNLNTSGHFLVRLGDGTFGSVNMDSSPGVGNAEGSIPMRKGDGTWHDGFRHELCEAIWGPEFPLTTGATITWSPSGSGLDAEIPLNNDATTLDVVTAVGGLEPGSRGRLRIVQDGTGGRAITLITSTRITAHMPNNGTIFTLSTGAGDVDIWDWYTPNGTDFYFSEFGTDFAPAPAE